MSVYEDVKIADMRFDSDQQMYFYNCPCGDLFEISLEELHEGEDIALCPSCSLKVRVIFEESDLPALGEGGLSVENGVAEPKVPPRIKTFASIKEPSKEDIILAKAAVLALDDSEGDDESSAGKACDSD